MKPKTRTVHGMSHPCGFTITELLVVILIIAVLAALLFPLARNMRASADRVKCVSQFKNWSNAIAGYAADNDGKYEVRQVAPVSYDVQGCSPYIEYWVSDINRVDEETYERSPSFDEAVRVHREMRCCPTLNKGGQTPVTISLVTPASGTMPSVKRSVRGRDMPLSLIKNPARFMLVIETTAGDNSTGYTTTPGQFEARVKPLTRKGADFRHKGMVNVLLADFAVKQMKWSDIQRGLSYWNVP
jgi:prepilin-type N-terminal cleavage/methylation domain-containing protein